MGNELLKIADGFSMVAEGLRGLAGMEWNGAVDMVEKDAAVPESGVAVDGYGKGEAAVDAVETGAAEAGDSGSGKGQKAGEADKKVDKKAADSKKAVAIEDVRGGDGAEDPGGEVEGNQGAAAEVRGGETVGGGPGALPGAFEGSEGALIWEDMRYYRPLLLSGG